MAVVFNVAADIAMFRKPYTTTSSVSFPVITPTAVAGLIAAITGKGNGGNDKACGAKYWQYLSGTKIAVKIVRPLRWRSDTINFFNVKNPTKAQHIQVKHQFIYRPEYQIFVSGGMEAELAEYVRAGRFVYTPYLGVAYALATVEYMGEFSEEKVVDSETVIALDSILPVVDDSDDFELDILSSGGMFSDKLPFVLSEERQLKRTIGVIMQAKAGSKIVLTKRGKVDVARVGNDNVAWFPAW